MNYLDSLRKKDLKAARSDVNKVFCGLNAIEEITSYLSSYFWGKAGRSIAVGVAEGDKKFYIEGDGEFRDAFAQILTKLKGRILDRLIDDGVIEEEE